MAKAMTKSACSPSLPKTKSTHPGKETCVLPVVQAHVQADFPAARRRRPRRVSKRPPVVLSETELNSVELDSKTLPELKLRLKKLKKTDLEDDQVAVVRKLKIIGPKLESKEIRFVDEDTSRLDALAQVAYTHLLALADHVALPDKDMNVPML